tara:strand:+ start:919 stop:1425 length:507 start_codon:yes stop_codon:yes gene_type:complete
MSAEVCLKPESTTDKQLRQKNEAKAGGRTGQKKLEKYRQARAKVLREFYSNLEWGTTLTYDDPDDRRRNIYSLEPKEQVSPFDDLNKLEENMPKKENFETTRANKYESLKKIIEANQAVMSGYILYTDEWLIDIENSNEAFRHYYAGHSHLAKPISEKLLKKYDKYEI